MVGPRTRNASISITKESFGMATKEKLKEGKTQNRMTPEHTQSYERKESDSGRLGRLNELENIITFVKILQCYIIPKTEVLQKSSSTLGWMMLSIQQEVISESQKNYANIKKSVVKLIFLRLKYISLMETHILFHHKFSHYMYYSNITLSYFNMFETNN